MLGDTLLRSIDPELQEDGHLQSPMVMDTLPCSVDPEPLPIPSESIPLITTSPYYKYVPMDGPSPATPETQWNKLGVRSIKTLFT